MIDHWDSLISLEASITFPKCSHLQFLTEVATFGNTYLQYLNPGMLGRPPPQPRVACCLLAREPHGLNFSVLFSVFYLFSFSLCCFSPSFLFYSHFAFAPRAWNQSQWEPGVYGFPAGVRGSDPLWVSHVGLVKPKRTHAHTNESTHAHTLS